MTIPRRIFVTGANGRIAKLLRSLSSNSRLPFIGVSRSPGPLDLSWKEFLHQTKLTDSDAILHAAWSALPLEAEREPKHSELIDLPLLLELAAKLDSSAQKPWLAFFSTAAVYGEAEKLPHDETSAPRPIGAYAAGKLRAENFLLEWASRSRVTTAILRISNVYGFPYDSTKPQGVHARLISCGNSGTPFPHWGVDTVKDYLHADDLLRGILRLWSINAEGVWNLCKGNPMALSTLIAEVERALGRRIAIQPETPHSSMDWDVRNVWLSGQKAWDVGIRPRIGPQEGIRKMLTDLS